MFVKPILLVTLLRDNSSYTLILNIVLKLTAIHKIYMTECIQFGEMTQ